MEGDRREKREQSAPRHALAITPGWHADPNFPARCSTSHHIRPFQVLPRLPLPWCHAGSGTTPKAEDTLTRERAQTALMRRDISGVRSGKLNPLPLKKGLHLKPAGCALSPSSENIRSMTSIAFLISI